MSLLFSIQNVGYVTSLYGNFVFQTCKNAVVGGVKVSTLVIEKVFRSLVITIENSYIFQLRSNLEIDFKVDGFLHQSYSQYPLLGSSAFCWWKSLNFFVLCETFLRVLSPLFQ